MLKPSIYLLIGLIIMVLSIAMAYMASERKTTVLIFSKNITSLDQPLPFSTITGVEYYNSNISQVVIKNTGLNPASINISCCNILESIYIEPGGKIELYNLTNPCLIIPIGRVDLEIVVWIEREVMPYSWLAIPSLILLFLSTGLLFTYVNTKMLEWKTSKSTS